MLAKLTVAAAALLAFAILPSMTVAGPVEDQLEKAVCRAATDFAEVSMYANHFVPGQVAPGVTVGVCIKNNGFVSFNNQDLSPHRPLSTLDNGQCFDSLTDTGGAVAPGASYSIRLHKHFTDYIQRLDTGEQCFNAFSDITPQRAVIPFHCATHPDDMKGIIFLKDF